MFVLTFLLVASLELAVADNSKKSEPVPEETPEELDMCVGCDDKKEEEKPKTNTPLVVEVRVDPVTGDVLYVIKGIVIE